MGMTLWLQVLEGDDVIKYQDDYTYIYTNLELLDKIANMVKVNTVSTYLDETEKNHNMAEDEFGGYSEYENALEMDEESDDDGYGASEMSWYDINGGLRNFKAICKYLDENIELPENIGAVERSELLNEFIDCIQKMEHHCNRGVKFHLAVII
jgi:hypothetical protein